VTTIDLIPDDITSRFEVHEWHNAAAVFRDGSGKEWDEVWDALRGFELRRSDIEAPGRNKSPISRRLDEYLMARGWQEKKFSTQIVVDSHAYDSPTHKVDCFKGRVALEVEWNNKDPFYDRDLNNFRLLYNLRAIDLGIVVTRSSELQIIFDDLGKGSSYGPSTTHMRKLLPRIEGGGGGGCPIIAVGITMDCFVDDVDGSMHYRRRR
jgi:hypothetical protein